MTIYKSGKAIITFGYIEVKTLNFHKHKRYTSNYDVKKYNKQNYFQQNYWKKDSKDLIMLTCANSLMAKSITRIRFC